jgi:putative addiction module component (TIGR02574 family)
MGTVAFEQMSVEQQIDHVQQLWDRIAATPNQIPVSAEHLTEIRRRRDLHVDRPERAVPLDEARRRLRSGE